VISRRVPDLVTRAMWVGELLDSDRLCIAVLVIIWEEPIAVRKR
jgi:hypothetical protein